MTTTTKKKAAPKKKMTPPSKSNINQNELQPVSQTEAVMNGLMTSIASGGLAPEQLKMVLDAQERILDRQAQQEFMIAMQETQKAMPAIKRNKSNTQTKSNYADLDAMIKTVTPIYTANGFSLTFSTGDSPHEHHVRVLCDVMHVGGWCERGKFIDIPLDMAGIGGKVNKTKVHGAGSAFSYGRRYLTAMIFNLTTNDDDDAVAAGSPVVDVISEQQLADLNALIVEVGSTTEQFAKYCRLDDLADMPLSKYKAACEALRARGENK